MSDLRIDNITNRTGDGAPVIAGVCTATGTGAFVVPVGPTELRGGRGRGVFGSGATPTGVNVMDMITIATTGDSIDFGDDHKIRQENYAAFSSSTRGINAGGYNPAAFADIHYFTFSSDGGMSHFGDLNVAVYSNAGCGNNIRGLSGGSNQKVATIEQVIIATTGDGSTFGELVQGASFTGSGINSPTRGIWHGGTRMPANAVSGLIDYVTITTAGNAIEFGELVTDRNSHCGTSNSTRGLIIAGQNPTNLNSIEYITIPTTGKAQDFGDVSNTIDYLGACASSTRGVSAGGQTPSKKDTIEYVTISTIGNALDFGDLTVARRFTQGCSDVHGGLG